MFQFLVPIAILAALAGCAPQKPVTRSSLREAYVLMDKGENAKAVVLMEELLEREPGNSEAKILLASALMGQAGVNIYSLHNSFQDVLFAEPLQDAFLEGGRGPDIGLDAGGPPRPDDSATPARRLFAEIDVFLHRMRRSLEFLNRFPTVPERQWPYLFRALEVIEGPGADRDVILYRIFVRIVLVRAALEARVVQDSTLGTSAWACRQNLDTLEEALRWISNHARKGSADFSQLYPERASSLNRIRSYLEAFVDSLDESREESPTGSRSSLLQAQLVLGNLLGCQQAPPSS